MLLVLMVPKWLLVVLLDQRLTHCLLPPVQLGQPHNVRALELAAGQLVAAPEAAECLDTLTHYRELLGAACRLKALKF
jgi:hypothetical protein